MDGKICATVTTALLVAAAALFAAAGCTGRAPTGVPGASGAGQKLRITVSIVPQKYFVERIGGEHVVVNVMVPPGASPATYEPKPEQLQALSGAHAYLAIGVPFESAWMERIRSANAGMMVVDTSQGIERAPIDVHHHGEEEQHEGEAENPDPHIWTSPRLVKVQARTIYDALVALDPDRGADYRANLDAFLADVDQLDARIRETLSGTENRTFMVFHPAWGYFATEYGLEMLPIEIEGKEPSASEMARLIAEAREERVKVIFAQPEFSTRSAETIAQEIGGQVLLISPLAPDWLQNLQSVADTFAKY
jgi:zinc transport system substrate-binding protein